MRNVVLLVFANKQDVDGGKYTIPSSVCPENENRKSLTRDSPAMRPNDVAQALDLDRIAKDHVWKVEPSCATSGEGRHHENPPIHINWTRYTDKHMYRHLRRPLLAQPERQGREEVSGHPHFRFLHYHPTNTIASRSSKHDIVLHALFSRPSSRIHDGSHPVHDRLLDTPRNLAQARKISSHETNVQREWRTS
jgi:hypothetical protein